MLVTGSRLEECTGQNFAQPTGKFSATLEILKRSVIEDTPVVFASSLGAEDMIPIDFIYRRVPEIQDFTIDTGHPLEETYTLRRCAFYDQTMMVIRPVR